MLTAAHTHTYIYMYTYMNIYIYTIGGKAIAIFDFRCECIYRYIIYNSKYCCFEKPPLHPGRNLLPLLVTSSAANLQLGGLGIYTYIHYIYTLYIDTVHIYKYTYNYIYKMNV